jgi:hypothetical protein
MPSSVGPNTFGEENLVFGYDLGDTANSYNGEPTVNLQAAGGAFGHSSGAYGNVVTVTDATSEKGPGWKKVTISNRGSNRRIIQFTYTSMTANIMYCHSAVFDWGNMRDKGYFINHDGSGTGTRAFYKPGDYSTNQGSSISINSNLADGKVAGTIIHTASHTHAFFINNNTTGVSGLNDYFYYKEYQVETNTHPTQYTSGTRSATQGLFDLTGNSSIDLSNVSFDSNAQMTFDGTDDHINLGDNSLFDFINGIATIEAIIKFPSTWTTGSQYPNLISKGATAGWDTNGWALFGFRDWPSAGQKSWGFGMRNGAVNRITSRPNASTNVYLHVVVTIDGSTIRLYENGTLYTTNSQTINPAENTTNVFIGRDAASQYFPGEISYTRVYNRALTSSEVAANYRAIKNRFNI